MKRKPSNNKTVRKRLAFSETPLEEGIVSTCDRKSKEILEIISKENELQRLRSIDKKQSVRVGAVPNLSDSSDDCDAEDERILSDFKRKEKENTLKDVPIVCKSDIQRALGILKPVVKKSLTAEEKRLCMLRKHCLKTVPFTKLSEEWDHTWESPMYIVKSIRACILTRNWNNLTRLLLMLLRHNKRYVSYAKQVALINLTNNPLDSNGELLQQLYELYMMPVSRTR